MSLVNLYIFMGIIMVSILVIPIHALTNIISQKVFLVEKSYRIWLFQKEISYVVIIKSTYLSANMISSVDFGIRVLADKNIQNIGDLIKEKKFQEVFVYLE